MKFINYIVLFISLSVFLFARPIEACIICHDITTSGEKKVQDLVREKGPEAGPELRRILSCPENTDLRTKMVVARELGRLRDRESIPILKRIVLEIIEADTSSPFAVITLEQSLREIAAASLRQMEVTGVGEEIWRNWRELPLERLEGLPRVLYSLQTPGLEDKLLQLLDAYDNEALDFQVLLELRRSGTSRSIPAIKKVLARWEEELSRCREPGRRRSLGRFIRYTKNTIQALKRR